MRISSLLRSTALTSGLGALASLAPRLALAADAVPASTALGSSSSTLFIAQIVALLVVGRLLGEFMLRLGQPAIMGQLLAGILLSPSVLGAVAPHAQQALFPRHTGQSSMLEAVAQLGILMLLLLTGMETDPAALSRMRRPAFTVSLFGIAAPFAAGFALGELLPASLLPHPGARLVTALFCAIALSISSVKIVAVVVRSMSFEHRRVGQILLAAAILDDTIGWILLAAILGLAHRGQIDATSIGRTVLGTLLFLAVSFTLGRRATSYLIRTANDHLRSDLAVITVILVIMGAFALATDALGVNTVLGAFVAGMLIGRSPILTRHIEEQLRGLVVALFMPVFFGLAGLTADLSILRSPALLGWAFAFIAVASVGKFAGSFIGGRLGRLSNRESFALGCGMNARGSTEVILATLGLSVGALTTTLFTLIVTMALVTTLAMPPMLRWALARVPMSDEENERLERAAFEARGYVPNLERLLAAVDQSASGTLAARFVGLLAGAWGLPTTVMPLARAPGAVPSAGQAEVDAVKGAMETAAPSPGDIEHASVSVQVAPGSQTQAPHDAIAGVAKRGFDLLWIGAEPGTDARGNVQGNIAAVESGFDGNVAIVFARGTLARNPRTPHPQILIAVNGTAHSRRAAEVALALAQACHGSVTALRVATDRAGRPWRRDLNLRHAFDGGDEVMLREIVELAQRYGTTVRPLLRAGPQASEVILKELRDAPYALLVLGVTRRAGEGLSWGSTAREVLAAAPESVLLHAS